MDTHHSQGYGVVADLTSSATRTARTHDSHYSTEPAPAWAAEGDVLRDLLSSY